MTTNMLIKEIRLQLNMSQKQLATQLNASFCTINRWENGHTKPSPLARTALMDLCKKSNLNRKLIDMLNNE